MINEATKCHFFLLDQGAGPQLYRKCGKAASVLITVAFVWVYAAGFKRGGAQGVFALRCRTDLATCGRAIGPLRW